MLKALTASKGSAPPRGALDVLVDVRAIEGAIVERKDGVFVGIVEVDGEMFRLMSDDEQDERLDAFGRMLNGLPYPVQITLFSEPAEVDGYVGQMEAAAARAGESALAQVAIAQAELARELSAGVQAESTVLSVIGRTAAEAKERAERLSRTMQSLGFDARLCGANRVGEVLQTVYGHVGRVPVGQALGGLNAAVRGVGDVGANATRLADVLSPVAVTESATSLDLGGAYAASYVAVAYPGTVGNSWLEPLLHFTRGSVRRRVSLHVAPIQTTQALNEITRQQRNLDLSAWFQNRQGRRADIYTDEARLDAEELRTQLARGSQRMFDITVLVTIIADTEEELRKVGTELKQEAAGLTLALRDCYLEQAPAFRSTVPLGMCLIDRPRPVPTAVACSTFPFTAGDLLHSEGLLWGVNYLTGNAVVVDPRRIAQPHWLFVAATRAGKSAAFKTLVAQLLTRGWSVIVVDPSPAIDYERFCRALGGSYIRFGVGYGDHINPCEIVLPADEARMRDPDFARPVSSKVAFLKVVLEMMAYPDEKMPSDIRARLEEPLMAAYAEKGLTDDWQSIVDTAHASMTLRPKPSPTLVDVLRHIDADPYLKDLAIRLQPFVRGTLGMFSGHTNVRTDGQFVVFNVNALVQTGGAHLQGVAYAMIAEHIQTRLLASRSRTMVGIDEAHVLFRREDTAQLVTFLARTAGKLGGAAAMMTQSITDLVGDPHTGVSVPGESQARVYLGQVGTTLLLRNSRENDRALLAEVYSLSAAERRFIGQSAPGRGVLIAGDDRVVVQVEPSALLWPLVQTNPEVPGE